MKEFVRILEKVRQCEKEEDQYQMIVFEGEAGIGKSRMLNAVVIKATEESPR